MKHYVQITAHWQLGLILLTYLILATAYSVVVPIGRGADEWAHYWYAQFIAENGRLPTSPAEREAAGYKSDWPPLYHLVAASLTFWIDTEGPPTFKYRADNVRRQVVPAQGPEAILHTEDERFPWLQEILVWHLGRFLSIVFSAGTLGLTYLIAREVIDELRVTSSELPSPQPSNPPTFQSSSPTSSQSSNPAPLRLRSGQAFHSSNLPTFQSPNLPILQPSNPHFLALLTTVVLAFNPRFLFTGMLFNYDSLTMFLSALFLWLSIRVVKNNSLRWSFWGLGGLAGLALVTKYLAAPLLLMIVVVGWLKARQGSRGAGGQRSRAGSQDSDGSPPTPHPLPPTTYPLLLTSYSLLPILIAVLAYLLIVTPWFAYLLINFNEIERYGPILGILAPLLRGDGSDRTVEQLFSWLSGGQAPSPDYIEQQSYTTWQIISQLPLTFWGNPVAQPYPLTWFVVVMSLLTGLAMVGLVLGWRKATLQGRRLLGLLVLYCLLPIPFMLIRLFGARDALEAMQGRHILFLAGPAFAVLFVWGLLMASKQLSVLRNESYGFRFMFYLLLSLLIIGSIGQLIFMQRSYPPPLPVQTTAYPVTERFNPKFTLPGGADLIDYRWTLAGQSLHVELFWRGGSNWAPADYLIELALVDSQGQTQSYWRAYQTQARYPTRAWEPGDTIRDEAWLPLIGLATGIYDLHLRLLDQDELVSEWQPLGEFSLTKSLEATLGVQVWHGGQPVSNPPILREREAIQIHNSQFTIHNSQLIGPDHLPHPPLTTHANLATFIIEPDWPAGAYALSTAPNRPLFRVTDNGRSFKIPAMTYSLDVNFDGKIKLLGYDLPSRRAAPGDGVPIILYWQGLDWFGEEFVIFTRLLDNQQVARGGYDRLARENYSTLFWAPGEIITDGFAIRIEPDAPDGVYWLNVGWYREMNGQAESLPILNLETHQPTESTAVVIGPIKVGQPPSEVAIRQADPQVVVAAPFGDMIELLGFDAPVLSAPQAAVLSDTLVLTLYWQARQLTNIDYAVFVHVRNEAGEIVAQGDGPPARGLYPTSLWDVGEMVEDQRQVSLVALEPGDYELVVGLYNLTNGVRLPIPGSSDHALVLGTFEIPARK